jgi:predicted SnoaL-like aldol condensation-catalyzing enzyme
METIGPGEPMEKGLHRGNRQTAVEFLRLAATGRVREAYEKFVGEGFRHHNPHFASGAPALQRAMEEAHRKTPNKGLDVQHVIEEGDLVAVHSRVRRDPQDAAVVHIFRFEDEQIVELWDVGMEVPDDLINIDGMF